MAWLYSFESKEIQKYIMRSDKLKEMVGGSEQINQLCDSYLALSLKSLGLEEHCTVIVRAAGWARIRFEEREKAEQLFACWPFLVERFAPGLQIIQSIEEIQHDDLPGAIKGGSEKLRYARNIVNVSLPEIGPLVERNPRTGLAAVAYERDRYLDRQSIRKLGFFEKNSLVQKITETDTAKKLWPLDMEAIAGDEQSYVAIIHADGNDLGKSLIAMDDHLKNHKDKAAKIFQGFSAAIEESTVEAVKKAFSQVIEKDFADNKKESYAARPIVLGGDDLTMVIRADLAFDFTVQFLEQFENTSAEAIRKHLGSFKINGLPQKLTACAGISFVKSSFPFSQGYELSESLCNYTKTIAKEKRDQNGYVPSSFTFHKVTSSLTDDYKTIIERELTAKHGGETRTLAFGPYSATADQTDIPSYTAIKDLAGVLSGFPVGTVRTLISTIYSDINQAGTEFNRILQIAGKEKAADFKNALISLTGNNENPLWNPAGATPLRDAHEIKGILPKDHFKKGEAR